MLFSPPFQGGVAPKVTGWLGIAASSHSDTSSLNVAFTFTPTASPALRPTAFTCDSTPFSHMSIESPMRPLVWATVAAATPRFCSISRAAMPALSLPTPASLKITAFSGTSSANSPELVPPCDAHTTIAPSSSRVTLVIESMTITRPLRPFATSFLSIMFLQRSERRDHADVLCDGVALEHFLPVGREDLALGALDCLVGRVRHADPR